MPSTTKRAVGSANGTPRQLPRSSPIPHMLIEGGDFEQWSDEIDAALRRKRNPRLNKFNKETAHLHTLDGPNGSDGSDERKKKMSAKAARLICSYVHPSILRRIPDHASKEPWELWKCLPDKSRPFRLMALPAELREKIFYEALLDWPVTIFCRDEQQAKSAIPPLLHSNRQVREEAAAVYYSETEFRCDFGTHVGTQASLTAAPVHVLMHDWTTNILGESKNHLRHLRLSFEAWARLDCGNHHHKVSMTITIKLNVDLKKKQRLEVEATAARKGRWDVAWLSQEKQKEFDAHIQRCNEIAQQYDWKGEVILHAISSNPGLWMFDVGDVVGRIVRP
ncbi:uncharacterized protein MYCFIDRAFT_83830 [Pseudocercospora fijiensis CIRAD86]|uniref:Uncharacterized protein n=1 Tax=Pseudocercospora fijiensis (strain CIRAD86) TaxID=383855 RepID=M2YM66_PSEFD|nr:uncharacterized protein MYCFIDRAFT_83830 [Pseudocercospora fijiensis CIRAD86]EME78820.1 hypothetical protein MYCFIDRAFT_83830 [Pseudocercospora fijiensis CIRAD86]